jgi:hypothetical protein
MMLIDALLDRGASLLFDVTDRNELHILLLQEATEVIAASISDSDSPHHDSITGRHSTIEPKCRTGNDGWRRDYGTRCDSGLLEELSARRFNDGCNSRNRFPRHGRYPHFRMAGSAGLDERDFNPDP